MPSGYILPDSMTFEELKKVNLWRLLSRIERLEKQVEDLHDSLHEHRMKFSHAEEIEPEDESDERRRSKMTVTELRQNLQDLEDEGYGGCEVETWDFEFEKWRPLINISYGKGITVRFHAEENL